MDNNVQDTMLFFDQHPAVYPLFFHQRCASVPCLTDFLTDGIVAVAELVEYKGIQLCGIDLACFVQHRLVCQHSDNFTNDMMTIYFHLVFNDFALQCQWKFLHNGSVYLFAFHSGQTTSLELVRHLVPRGNAKEIGGFDMGNVCNAQRERTVLFDNKYCQ